MCSQLCVLRLPVQQDEIGKLRSRLAEEAREHTRRTSSLKEDRNSMKMYLRRVKADVSTQRRQEDARMKQLTVITGQVIKVWTGQVRSGQQGTDRSGQVSKVRTGQVRSPAERSQVKIG